MSQPGPSGGDDGWRRLDRRMLLIHPLQALVRSLPALIPIFLARAGTDDSDRWELYLLPVIVAYGLLRWLTTRYRIEDGQIELRRGVLTKQTTTARLDKVRTVDLTAQVHHRVLGLAKVEISTGSSAKERLVLDSLGAVEARRLREELLHRADAVQGRAGADPVEGLPPPTGAPLPAAVADEELLRLDPVWVRYAPFTATGLASAAAIFGFVSQTFGRVTEEGDVVADGLAWVRGLALWIDVVGVVVIVSLLAVGAYVLSFWGFRLTRNLAGSLHTRRGLLTNRETSIDRARLRGVSVGEPLGLRLAKGARLKAVSTGLEGERGGGSDWLSPPAPAAVVAGVATEVVADPVALTGPLVEHGPAARRRRLSRAVLPAVLVAGLLGWVAAARDWPGWFLAVPAALVAASVALGLDRYRGLGHAVTERHLVTREGSLDRQRVVLDRDGVIGWRLRQSFFQRRAGVATLVATTGAGQQHYDLVDVAPDRAVAVMAEVTPELLAEFS